MGSSIASSGAERDEQHHRGREHADRRAGADSGACSVFPIAWPPSWTLSPGARAALAALMTRVMSALARLSACLAKSTVAYAMRPSRLICAAPRGPYGLTTAATSGIVATCRSTAVIRAMTAGSRTVPWLTCQTIVSESPAWAGTALASSCWAVAEPVPGSEKELL